MENGGNKVEFGSMTDLLLHLDKLEKEIGEKLAVYKGNVSELTGHDLSKPVTALDVVKIVQKVFFSGVENNK